MNPGHAFIGLLACLALATASSCRKSGGGGSDEGETTPAGVTVGTQPGTDDGDGSSDGALPVDGDDDDGGSSGGGSSGGTTTDDGSDDSDDSGDDGAEDANYFDFDVTLAAAAESTASPIVEVPLTEAATANCSASFHVSGGNASLGSGPACQPGDDFLLAGLVGGIGSIELLAGDTKWVVPITLCPDTIYESDETIAITVDNPVGCGLNAPTGTSHVHTFTIDEDDAQPTMSFAQGSSSGAESVVSNDITVNLSNATSATITVNYTVGGTASAAGVDHGTASGSLTFNPGDTSKTISITGVEDDTLYETNGVTDETVTLTLSGLSAGATLAAPSTHTYTITENDAAPTVGFALASSSGSEPNNGDGDVVRSITVNLSDVAGVAVTVDYQDDADGSATAASDYDFVGGTLTFSPGETSKTIDLSIVDDTDAEGEEDVNLSLSNPANATLATSTHTHTINTSDASYEVAFNAPASARAESDGALFLAVDFSGVCPHTGVTYTVDYSISGSSTAQGADYSFTGGTLTWTDNDCAGKNVPITMVNDTAFETAETVIVQLTNASAGLSVGGNSSHTITIADDAADAPTVEFQAGTANGEESSTTPVVTVQLNLAGDPTQRSVTVDYAVNTGASTASAGDYSLAAGTVTIPAGSTSATVPLTIVNDSLPDNGETVVVTLSNPGPAGVTLDAEDELTYTIDDSQDVAAPTELTHLGIIVNAGTEATLHWTTGGGTTSDFRIAYATGATAPVNCSAGTTIGEGSISGTNQFHKVAGLISGTQYSFRVCAINTSNPPAASAGLTRTATVQAAAYPPACDSTVSANTTFSAVQTTLNAATAGTDGITTVCINENIVVSNNNTLNHSRLSVPTSHFMLRSSSGRAMIDTDRTNGAGAAEHAAIYAAAKHNVTLSGLKITTEGSAGRAIEADGSVLTRVDDIYALTNGAGGAYGVYLSGGSTAYLVDDVTIQTAGANAHGIYLAGASSVRQFTDSKVRRASTATDDSAVGVLFENATNNYFDSSSGANWGSLYVCDINHATITWKHYRGNSTNPLSAAAWSDPGSYTAYNGAAFNAQTFPEGQAGVTSNATCPPSWTTVYNTVLVPGGDGSLCLTSCHAAGQTNKWNLTTQDTGYTDGIAKGHFCLTCDPVTTRADCETSNFLFKTTKGTSATALGWTNCEMSNKLMPKSNVSGQFTQAQTETIRAWLETGAKND